jgi:hypothetical protein
MAFLMGALPPDVDATTRLMIALISGLPAILGSLGSLAVSIGTLIAVLRGRRQITEVKELVDSRMDQLLQVLPYKGKAEALERAQDQAIEATKEAAVTAAVQAVKEPKK